MFRTRALLPALLVILAGCSPDRLAAPSAGPADAAPSAAAATANAPAPPPAADRLPSQPGAGGSAAGGPDYGDGPEAGPRIITYENITFRVPPSWRLAVRGGVAGLGDFVPRPGRSAGPSLVVSVSESGTIDQEAPTRCERGPAVSIDVVQAGFAPVGARTADFRFWITTCEDGSSEEKRAWLLPNSKISFVEQYHVSDNVEVVTTAEVA